MKGREGRGGGGVRLISLLAHPLQRWKAVEKAGGGVHFEN